jgi:hypothetical protein
MPPLSSGYTVLTGLSSLRQLTMTSCTHLPACLSQLTGLEALTIDDREEHIADADAAEATIVQAVGQLRNLPHLAVINVKAEGLEQTFPSLSRLCQLGWLTLDPTTDAALPAGGWLTDLRRLALSICQLHNSLEALESARQLQALALNIDENSELLPRVLRWAARRPALTELYLGIPPDQLYMHFGDILELQRCTPELRITAAPSDRSVMV